MPVEAPSSTEPSSPSRSSGRFRRALREFRCDARVVCFFSSLSILLTFDCSTLLAFFRTGIKWYPKYQDIPAIPVSNSTSGYIYALQNGTVPDGTCVISGGTWYKGGTW